MIGPTVKMVEVVVGIIQTKMEPYPDLCYIDDLEGVEAVKDVVVVIVCTPIQMVVLQVVQEKQEKVVNVVRKENLLQL